MPKSRQQEQLALWVSVKRECLDDQEIVVGEQLSDEQIVTAAQSLTLDESPPDQEDLDDCDLVTSSPPTNQEAKSFIDGLINYFECQSADSSTFISQLLAMKNNIESNTKLKQLSIKDFIKQNQ